MKVSLLGYGLAGEAFHAPLIHVTGGLELATIVTGNPERAARAAERYPNAVVTADSDAAWAADLVVVATPNRFHASYAHEALARGVAAVIDKPLAPTLHDVDVLLADAASLGGKLTVFQNRRWDGDFQTARRLIGDGTLGEITRFFSRAERFRPEIKDAWREAADPRDGGGQLLDWGSHLVDQALLLLGPARSVYAEIAAVRPAAQTDDDVFVIIEHDGGARSHLSMGAVAAVPTARMAINGTLGGLEVRDTDVQEAQLRAGLTPASDSYGLNPPGVLYSAGKPAEQPIERGAYQQFYARVPAWLAGSAPAPVDPADSHAVFTVLEAARTSAASSAVVTLS
jgi:scyllo-inositol 2-dehydrogenase (NADP+)